MQARPEINTVVGVENPLNQHSVQFYEAEACLNEKVFDYVSAGLAADEICIVVGTSARLAYLTQHLDAAQFSRCLMLEAESTLAMLMVDGQPSEERFAEVVGSLVANATARSRVRIFGEMVALLCEGGNYRAACQLEDLWNALALRHSFSLLCAYSLSSFPEEAHGQSFQKICEAHNYIAPTESISISQSQQDLFRSVATLQQKARALEAEVMRRKKIEVQLNAREQELSDFLANALEGLHRLGPDGRILWANQVELDLLGYAAQEYIGQPSSAFFADAEVGRDLLARQLGGEDVYDYPVRLHCRDGSIKHVLIHSNALRDNDGELVSVRCFTRDITDQVRLEQARRRHLADREAERALRAAHEELEQRVGERTARLERSNARLIAEIAERKRAESALQQSQQLLRELAQHTEKIIEGERKRIARELHDQLGQNLMALRIDVLMMNSAVGSTPAKVGPMAASALHNIDSMIKNVRSIINNLRPAVLDLGLVATIEWEVREFERRTGITCDLVSDHNEFEQLDDARALALLRILQESLTNVQRHARANRVDIRLHSDGKTLCLCVADDGVGGYSACRRKANAFGLLGIQERVSAFGGELAIETGEGKGLALTVTLPL